MAVGATRRTLRTTNEPAVGMATVSLTANQASWDRTFHVFCHMLQRNHGHHLISFAIAIIVHLSLELERELLH